MFRTLLFLLTSLVPLAAQEAQPKPAPAAPAAPAVPAKPKKSFPKNPTPTHANVAYGKHERQVLDAWIAPGEKPTPVVLCIHGGGWHNGQKESFAVEPFLKAGLSVVAINYRYIEQCAEEVPPVKGPMGDAMRALQFIRSKAKEWNIDKERIGATGGSAGACSSLWLAFHSDMADAKSTDPVARESTRLWCAAVNAPQTSLDPKQMKEWTPNSSYGGHAFGFTSDPANKLSQFDVFLAKRDTILPWIAEYSPYALVTSDDPPIFIHCPSGAPAIGQPQKDPTHTANFGLKLQEHCQANKVPCELLYPGATGVKYPDTPSYLMAVLKQEKAK
jgi:acetyl esterase/lipase